MTPAPPPPVFLGMPRPEQVADGRLRVGNASHGGLVASEVLWLRTRGQRFRMACGRRLELQQGLFLAPAPAVHAFGARHDLRVLFLDRNSRVLAVELLRRWRARPSPAGTAAALLLHPENPVRAEVGHRLEWLAPQPRLPGRADWLEQRGYPPGA